MALRELLLRLGVEVDDKGTKKATSALSSIKKAAIATGAVFLTGKLAQGFASLIEDASDAAETVNKFGAVFEESTAGAAETAEELAKRIGQSRIDIQGMTADVGALVKPLLGSSEAAAEMAARVTELSFDISSFENVLPQDALTAMRSALIGSSEPMLRFGVDTRQAALAQFALDKGVKTAVKDMKAQEVTALRLELIMERLGTKGAVGDATRTAGGFANRARALEGVFKDLRAELGDVFLPVATEFLGVLIELVRDVAPELKAAMEGLLFVFKLLGTAVKAIISPFKRLDTALLAIGSVTLPLVVAAFGAAGTAGLVAGLKAAAAWVIATLPLLLMIGLIAIIVAAIIALIEDFVTMGEGGESATGTIVQGFLDLVDTLGSIPAAIADILTEAVRFWAKFFQDALGLSDEFIESLTTSLQTVWGAVLTFMTERFNVFIEGITSAFGAIGGLVSDLFGGEASISAANAGAAAITRPGGIRAPAGAGGNTSMVNNPETSISVQVDATNQSNPQGVATETARAIKSVTDAQNRQASQAFQVSSGS